MLVLTIEVPEARDRTAFATLRDGRRTVASGAAVACATPAYAAKHANPACDPLRPGGHPPFGRYRLIHHERTDARQASHYGKQLLLFEPQSGAALDAESFGRLGLLVFGGAGRWRTQGGVRVANKLLDAIMKRVAGGAEVTLELDPIGKRAWWQFWKAAPPPSETLTSALDSPQAPNDELTLLEALLQKAPRRAKAAADDRPDRDFHRDTRDDRSGSSSEPRAEPFQGRGGETGGGGASGSWSDAPQRGAGVDGAGRIVGAAAAVGAIAAAAALAGAHASAERGTNESGDSGPAADTGTGTSY